MNRTTREGNCFTRRRKDSKFEFGTVGVAERTSLDCEGVSKQAIRRIPEQEETEGTERKPFQEISVSSVKSCSNSVAAVPRCVFA